MSAEDYEGLKRLQVARKEFRQMYAEPCKKCQELLPKAHPKMLLPKEWCTMHEYRDNRPYIARELYDAVLKKHGIEMQR